MNAWFAGVDLLGTILTLARSEHPPPQPESRPGVRSRQLLVGILGAAEHFRTRRAVLAELNTALSCTGDYRGAAEELTPWKGDPLALVPVVLSAPRKSSYLAGLKIDGIGIAWRSTRTSG